MSFSLTVTVENGTATVAGQTTGTAAPPDGTFYIGGHQGSDYSTLSVQHGTVGSATAHIVHPQPEQEI